MSKVKIVTDSNSGITQSEAKERGVYVLPMPFLIDGEEYFEDINLTQEEFYRRLTDNATVSTSQPSTASVTALWDELIADGSELVYIPMSSGLSQSCNAATVLARDYEGKVYVVDNQRISLSQKQSVYDALYLAGQGLSAKEIAQKLTQTKLDASIYISLDTLKYLKKGGRLTPAAALIGTLFHVKSVLQIQGDKLDAYQKVHTSRHAKEAMVTAVRNDLQTRFADLLEKGEIAISVAHTNNYEKANEFASELKAAFPNVPLLYCDPLSLSVSCHIGAGALAIACFRVIK